MLGSLLLITFAVIIGCCLIFFESWHKPWRLPTKMAAFRSIVRLWCAGLWRGLFWVYYYSSPMMVLKLETRSLNLTPTIVICFFMVSMARSASPSCSLLSMLSSWCCWTLGRSSEVSSLRQMGQRAWDKGTAKQWGVQAIHVRQWAPFHHQRSGAKSD